jgi:arginyl-tRNA synthetase
MVPRDIVRDQVTSALQNALQQARQKGQLATAEWPAITVDLPKRPEWGDLATAIAMGLASQERRSPKEVAQIILENLDQPRSVFDHIEIAAPGFLNMTVKRDLWMKVLSQIEIEGGAYGQNDLGKGRRVLIEYVSANPTGPMHIGHGRGAAVGDAIANLLKASGFDVSREYYINDAGRQIKLLGQSVYARYRQRNGLPATFPEDGYQGAYVEKIAERAQERLGPRLAGLPAAEAEQQCQEFAYREMMDVIRQDLRSFGIAFDSWASEASLVSAGAVTAALEELRRKDLLFDEEGASWFRSSAYGDEKDRVIRKQDGEYTYLASDVAYHRDKLQRGYDLLIDVWGADHHGYIPRMQAVVQGLGYPKDRLRIVLVQMVSLLRGGKKVEMSKRAGEFVTLREVVDEVGADVAKFFFLMRSSDRHLDFDLELAKQQSADNPVYYVQYAHARVASLFRVAESRGITVPKPSEADLTTLADPDEFTLIRKLSAYPSVVEGSAAALEPHRIVFYLQELAQLLHTFYFKHRILPPAVVEEDASDAGRFVKEAAVPSVKHREQLTPRLTGARLALMGQVGQVIRNGLGLLGVSAPERM